MCICTYTHRCCTGSTCSRSSRTRLGSANTNRLARSEKPPAPAAFTARSRHATQHPVLAGTFASSRCASLSPSRLRTSIHPDLYVHTDTYIYIHIYIYT